MDLNKSLESLLPESDGVKMVITEDAQTLNTAARHQLGQNLLSLLAGSGSCWPILLFHHCDFS